MIAHVVVTWFYRDRNSGELPHTARFAFGEKAEDTTAWHEDSLQFLVSDTSLITILHFGVRVTGG